MTLSDMLSNHRKEDLKAVLKFITSCNYFELYKIVNEIRTYHDNLFVWDQYSSSNKKVSTVTLDDNVISFLVGED